MKHKLLKRSLSFIIAVFMSIIATGTVFAAESTSTFEMNAVTRFTLDVKESAVVDTLNGNVSVSPLNNELITDVVLVNSSITARPRLESYIGLSQNFIVSSISDSKSGVLLIYLYNPSGKLVSKDWIMGVNEATNWKVTLPSSGTWTVEIVAQGNTAPVVVTFGWQPKD